MLNHQTLPTRNDTLTPNDRRIPWGRLVVVSLALQLLWLVVLFGGWRLSDVVASGDGQWFFLMVLGVPLLLMELAIGPMLVFAMIGASLSSLTE